ncbi:MAG TPA: substrate-binding domain-containing protein [Feifaniaceae bacterium]|nr:substrate-binding domain-containing protein [Feifaniaceae bacterium]
MRQLQKGVCLVLALLCALSLGGCKENQQPVKDTDADKGIVMGFSMATLLEDRWIRDRDIFLAKAKQEGVEVIVKNANKDSDLQYEQVLDMLEQGIDVLILAPNDSKKEVRCVEAAKQKGVPVISYDRLVEGANVDVYVSFDHNQVGVLMGEALLKRVPGGGYVVINGSPNDYNSTMIREGLASVLDPHIENGELSVIAETWVDGWVRETAYSFAQETLRQKGEDIEAIVCGNDSLAWGVIDALSEVQRTGEVAVVGMDADLVACRRIVQGQQLMTVYKPIRDLVEATLEVAGKLVCKEPVEAERTINNGAYDVPFIAIGVHSVTKDNIEQTVIADGFHLREEIYRSE